MPRSITYSSYRYSLYAQGDYSPRDDHKFVAGFQTNKVEGLNPDTSPRLGYIHQFNHRWGSKLLYGEAFRSAAGTEQLLPAGSGGVIGSDSLDPEKIKTLEAQLFYSTTGFFAAITLFRSKISDVIDRVQISPGVSQFINVPGRIDSKGIELESKIVFTKNTHFVGSATYQENKNEDGDPETPTPQFMFKLGINHNVRPGFAIGIFDNYFADPERPDSLTFPPTSGNPDPVNYHLLTAQMVINVPRLLASKFAPDMTFYFYADNLLDEDIYYPEINNNTINSIPIYSGRAFYGTVEIKL
jgi:outer membrane receptor for ferrienterochelin and colicin